jgi:hypothetical protein
MEFSRSIVRADAHSDPRTKLRLSAPAAKRNPPGSKPQNRARRIAASQSGICHANAGRTSAAARTTAKAFMYEWHSGYYAGPYLFHRANSSNPTMSKEYPSKFRF